jgi:hypothetical protein
MLLVTHPPAFGGQPLPGTHGRQGTEDRHQIPLTPNLYPKYGKPALFVEEGDSFHESGYLL